MRRLRGVPASVFVALLAGCAPTARLVLVEPAGGAVAIHRNTPAHREKALALMAQQCPRGYDIVREEEVVTGAKTEVAGQGCVDEACTFVSAKRG